MPWSMTMSTEQGKNIVAQNEKWKKQAALGFCVYKIWQILK